MKIVYKEEEIELKQTFRTLMIYENIAEHSFTSNGNITSMILYFYCNVLACSKNGDVDFDEFMDFIDKQPELLTDYFDWLGKQNKLNNLTQPKIKKKTK